MAKKVYTPAKTFDFNGEIIDFYERRGRLTHLYVKRDTDEIVKSVTGAIGIINKPLLIPWACKLMGEALENGASIKEAKMAWRTKRDTAADKGTQTHDWIENYILSKINKDVVPMKEPNDVDVQNAILAFREWEVMHGVKFIATEDLVYSKKHNFVGTLDCVAEIGGKRCLIDFKTSKGIYPEMIYQVAGYKIAYEEFTGEKFDEHYIIRFGKEDAEFEFKKFKITPKIKKGFLSCLHIKQMEGELKKVFK